MIQCDIVGISSRVVPKIGYPVVGHGCIIHATPIHKYGYGGICVRGIKDTDLGIGSIQGSWRRP